MLVSKLRSVANPPLSVSILLAFATLGLAPLAAQVLPVAGDAQVNRTYPSTNFGTLPYMQVGGSSSAYVKFDTSSLAGIDPSNVMRARLVLWTNGVGVAGSIDIAEVGSQWEEVAVTQETTPSSVASVATVATSRASSFMTVDVTARLQKWMATPGSNHGLALSAATAAPLTVVFFDTKESVSTSHAPQLEVLFRPGTGPEGPRGEMGQTGPAGPIGPTGLTGGTGPVGPAGPIGSNGPAGPTGATGPTGLTGPAGATGPIGPIGPAGPTGATGAVGPQGPVGLTGATGATGAVGPQGPIGLTGATGAAGAPGATGAVGPQGPIGLTGATGAAGAAGAQGPQGLQGVQGPAGATGATGPTGATGATGAAGAAGSGNSAFAYIYNTSAQVVPLESDISFSNNGVNVGSSISHVPGTSLLIVATAGNYSVRFTVSSVEPNQFTVFVNGAPASGATFGSGAGTQMTIGEVILTLASGDVLTLRNHTSAAAVTLQTLAGGTQTNSNASMMLVKLN